MAKEEQKVSQPEILDDRRTKSLDRLDQLKKELEKLSETQAYPGLTIIAAGSLARLEASEFSDIDMFFFTSGKVEEPRTKELKLFGKLIDVIDNLGFPKFSRDCQYLSIMSTEDMFDHLGSSNDDHQNFFTARMLLLLESKCLYGEEEYENLIDSVVKYYYRDYNQHEKDFKPTFLLNDICRYWKTILLNYENRISKRKNDDLPENEEERIKRKVHNFKLKYSRVTTCFATICAIGSLESPVNSDKIKGLVHMTPRERLEEIPKRVPETREIVEELLEKYSFFIHKTGLSEPALNQEFADPDNAKILFDNANEFGDLMFRLLEEIDQQTSPELKLIRHLVI